MSKVKITTIGNSLGIVLPKEVISKMNVGKGDSLYLIETKNGIELTIYNPEFAKQVDLAKDIIRKNRDVLKKLAE